jgi:hypothetical protein
VNIGASVIETRVAKLARMMRIEGVVLAGGKSDGKCAATPRRRAESIFRAVSNDMKIGSMQVTELHILERYDVLRTMCDHDVGCNLLGIA